MLRKEFMSALLNNFSHLSGKNNDPNKDNVQRIEQRSREGIFDYLDRNKKQKEIKNIHENVKIKLTEYIEKIGYQLGTALSEGDCFFDAIDQGAERANVTIPNEYKGQFGYKILRQICNKFAKTHSEDKDHWLKKQIEKDKGSHQDYLATIQYSAPEMEKMWKEDGLFSGTAIWGRPDIDGRIICDVLKIRLHILEIKQVEKDIIFNHQLIDGNGSQTILEKEINNLYGDEKIIHMVIYQGSLHYVPFMRPVLANKKIDVAERVVTQHNTTVVETGSVLIDAKIEGESQIVHGENNLEEEEEIFVELNLNKEHVKNNMGLEVSSSVSFEEFQKKAEGDANRLFLIGWMYDKGYAACGININRTEARKWYLMAAELKHPMALYNLGCLEIENEYHRKMEFDALNGIGFFDCAYFTPHDVNLAIKYFNEAASLRNVEAAYALGIMYWKGHYGVKREPETALKLLRFAAEEGLPEALAMLINFFKERASKQFTAYMSCKKYSEKYRDEFCASCKESSSHHDTVCISYKNYKLYNDEAYTWYKKFITCDHEETDESYLRSFVQVDDPSKSLFDAKAKKESSAIWKKISTRMVERRGSRESIMEPYQMEPWFLTTKPSVIPEITIKSAVRKNCYSTYDIWIILPGLTATLNSEVLLIALEYGNIEFAKNLLANKNIDINYIDKKKMTAMDYAIDKDYSDLAYLIANVPEYIPNLNNSLFRAVTKKNNKIINLLLSLPTTKVNGVIITLLFENGEYDVLKKLLAFKNEIDINIIGKQKMTPMELVIEASRPDLAMLIAKVRGFYPNLNCPLLKATDENEEAIVKLLLTLPELDVNQTRSPGSETALWIAARKGYQGIAQLLLKHKEINVAYQCKKLSQREIEALTQSGKNKASAYEIAVIHNQQNIAQIIMDSHDQKIGHEKITCERQDIKERLDNLMPEINANQVSVGYIKAKLNAARQTMNFIREKNRKRFEIRKNIKKKETDGALSLGSVANSCVTQADIKTSHDKRNEKTKDELIIEFKKFREAAERNDPDKLFLMGWMYDKGYFRCDVDQNVNEAKKWYAKAAKLKQSMALYNLACIIVKENNIEDAVDTSSFEFTRETKARVSPEYYELAPLEARKKTKNLSWCDNLHYNDLDLAYLCLVRAANQNNADAQFALGDIYETWSTKTLGRKWIHLAAINGLPQAQGALAHFYYYGIGIEKNPKIALEWFRKLANCDYKELDYSYHNYINRARYFLGLSYEFGMKVEKNLELAANWYEIIAVLNYADARNRYERAYGWEKPGRVQFKYEIGEFSRRNTKHYELTRAIEKDKDYTEVMKRYEIALLEEFDEFNKKDDIDEITGYRKYSCHFITTPSSTPEITLRSSAAHNRYDIYKIWITLPGINVSQINNESLFIALENGHVEFAKKLLATNNIDVNFLNKNLKSIIELVIEKGFIDIAWEVINSPGFNPNLNKPLSKAFSKKETHIAKMLVSHPDFQIANEYLIVALENEFLEFAKLFLASEEIDINFIGKEKKTAIEVCIEKNYNDMAFLIAVVPGFNPDLNNLLLKSIINNNYIIFNLLLTFSNIKVDSHLLALTLENGQYLFTKKLLIIEGIDVNYMGQQKMTPIELVIDASQPDLAALIIRVKGFNPNLYFPLIKAADENEEAIVKLLLSIPTIDVNATRDPGSPTALWIAARKGNDRVVRLLLSHKDINVDYQCKQLSEQELKMHTQSGKTKLSAQEIAKTHQHRAIVQIIQDYKDQKSARERAIRRGPPTAGTLNKTSNLASTKCISINPIKSEILEKQLKEIRDSWKGGKMTDIELAIDASRTDLAEYLINAIDFDPNINCPLIMAADGNEEAIVQLLVNLPTLDVNATHEPGSPTALWIAARRGNEGVVRCLLSHNEINIDYQCKQLSEKELEMARSKYGKTKLSVQEIAEIYGYQNIVAITQDYKNQKREREKAIERRKIAKTKLAMPVSSIASQTTPLRFTEDVKIEKEENNDDRIKTLEAELKKMRERNIIQEQQNDALAKQLRELLTLFKQNVIQPNKEKEIVVNNKPPDSTDSVSDKQSSRL